MRNDDYKKSEAYKARLAEAMGHLKFCCRVYRWQVDRAVECFKLEAAYRASFKGTPGVELVCGDQFPFGQESKGPDGIVGLARRRTGWLTNSPCVGGALNVKCCNGRRGQTPPAEHVQPGAVRW